jgi:hypothetical protein
LLLSRAWQDCEQYHDKRYILFAKYYSLNSGGPPIKSYNEVLMGRSSCDKAGWVGNCFRAAAVVSVIGNKDDTRS